MPTTNGSSIQKELLYYNNFYKFTVDLLTELGEMKFPFSSYHKEMADTLVSKRQALIIVPRGHIKSCMLNCYITWRMFREKDYKICIASATRGQAKKNNIDWVERTIEKIPWLQHLKPEGRELVWNKEEFRTTNSNYCFLLPFKESARGPHPNETLFDDILRDADISQEDIKNIFWSVFYPMGQQKGAKKLIVGTPNSQDDLFAEIEEKSKQPNSGWFVYKRSAIEKDKDGNEKPLWDERYTLEDLYTMKTDMGSYRFARELLCDPSAEGQGFYPQELILAATDDNLKFTYNTTGGKVYFGVDLAMSDSVTGDYNVFTVIEALDTPLTKKINKNGKFFTVTVEKPIIIRHIERYKGGFGQVRKIKELYEIYKPIKIIVDISNFGIRFYNELLAEGLPVYGQNFQPANRALLLANLRKLFETEDPLNDPPRLVIPTSQENFTYDTTKILLHELSGFRETSTKGGFKTIASNLSHDDVVFGLAMAVKEVVNQNMISDDLFYEIPNKTANLNSFDNIKSNNRTSFDFFR